MKEVYCAYNMADIANQYELENNDDSSYDEFSVILQDSMEDYSEAYDQIAYTGQVDFHNYSVEIEPQEQINTGVEIDLSQGKQMPLEEDTVAVDFPAKQIATDQVNFDYSTDVKPEIESASLDISLIQHQPINIQRYEFTEPTEIKNYDANDLAIQQQEQIEFNDIKPVSNSEMNLLQDESNAQYLENPEQTEAVLPQQVLPELPTAVKTEVSAQDIPEIEQLPVTEAYSDINIQQRKADFIPEQEPVFIAEETALEIPQPKDLPAPEAKAEKISITEQHDDSMLTIGKPSEEIQQQVSQYIRSQFSSLVTNANQQVKNIVQPTENQAQAVSQQNDLDSSFNLELPNLNNQESKLEPQDLELNFNTENLQITPQEVTQPSLPMHLQSLNQKEVGQTNLNETRATQEFTSELHDPEWNEKFSEHVHMLVNSNINQARIQLNPKELGHIEAKISLDGNEAKIILASHDSSVCDAINQSLPKLRELFHSSGMQLADVSVTDQNLAREKHEQASQQQHRLNHSDLTNVKTEEQVNTESPTNNISSDNKVDYYI